MMELIQILAPYVAGIITAIASIITIKRNSKKGELDSIRCQLLVLMLEDSTNNNAENYKEACDLFDKYRNLGGNSYIIQKFKRYQGFVDNLKGEKK